MPDRTRARAILAVVLLTLVAPAQERAGEDDVSPRFTFPCQSYAKGLRGKGNFGLHVTRKGSPFHGSWHLAEDVWLPAGTEVRAVADGVVRYSAFSPTWIDEEGHVHWNLGDVIVIEHALEPPLGELEAVCSFYVHLAADRRVAVGERVARGQPIGRIGADLSEENGRYPEHLHFGLHRGLYVQIPPSLARELRAAARSKDGLRFGQQVLRGELTFELQRETNLLIRAEQGGPAVLSLLVGSTAPKDPPPDIMGWCEGYGAKPPGTTTRHVSGTRARSIGWPPTRPTSSCSGTAPRPRGSSGRDEDGLARLTLEASSKERGPQPRRAAVPSWK